MTRKVISIIIVTVMLVTSLLSVKITVSADEYNNTDNVHCLYMRQPSSEFQCKAQSSNEFAALPVACLDKSNLDFIRGIDISSYISLKNSGVVYRNFNGDLLDDDSFFAFLKDNSINYIRVRIWNDPYDKDKNGYGGGNCDIENACKIGAYAAKQSIKILADFHLSDFWADPATQKSPKQWSSYTFSQKQSAVYDYVYNSLVRLGESGAKVGMVQIGNEINSGMCGETDINKVALLLNSGFSAVEDYDSNILRAVHYTDPQKQAFEWYADMLNKNEVEYDVFASSYYSYWHGSVQNFTYELKKVADKYNKFVMCAETAYPFTEEDSDFYANNVSGYEDTLKYPVSIYGQSLALRDVFSALKSIGDKGLGVFYWEPAWITVGTTSYEENYSLWQKYGSGWETSFACDYCDDGAKWHGGSSWDNQALFDKTGKALESLKVFSEFDDIQLKGDVNNDGVVSIIDATEIQKYIVELADFTDKIKKTADVNNDGYVTIEDATQIQKHIAEVE